MIDMLNRNLTAKIIALIVAIILWFFVMNEQNPAIDGTFTVPLEVTNVPEGYMVNHSVESIKLKVRGPRSLFAIATEKDFHAYVDLSDIKEGRHTLKVQTVLPQGVELVGSSPEAVIFDIDKVVKKDMKVDIAFSGTPMSGVTIGKAVPDTEAVTVEGPSEAVNQVARVAGYVNLSGRSTDFNVDVPLVAVDSEGKDVPNVQVVPASVKVNISIVKGLYKRNVELKAELDDDLPAGLVIKNIKLEPESIEIYGDQRLVDTIDFINTEKISLADIQKSAVKQVKLQLPIGINVTNDVITVRFETAAKTEKPAKE